MPSKLLHVLPLKLLVLSLITVLLGFHIDFLLLSIKFKSTSLFSPGFYGCFESLEGSFWTNYSWVWRLNYFFCSNFELSFSKSIFGMFFQNLHLLFFSLAIRNKLLLNFLLLQSQLLQHLLFKHQLGFKFFPIAFSGSL